MKKIVATAFSCFFIHVLLLGQVPAPAPVQSQPIVITGGTAHLGTGEVIENAVLIFENGKFTQVAAAQKLPIPTGKQYQQIDASGKHIYPGFIALNTTLGLEEISAVRATRDFKEVGSLNPSVRALIAYNTDSQVTPTVRSNGILTAEIVPQGGIIAGQSSLVQLDAWNWEDAAVVADLAIHIYWPRRKTWSWKDRAMKENKNYQKQLSNLEQFLAEAKAYRYKEAPENTNLKFEAMQGALDGSKKVMIHVQSANAIREAILLAKRNNLNPIIVGGRDAWLLTDFLKKNKVPVILGQTQSLPANEDTDIDQPFKTPALLQAAGVEFAVSCSSRHGGLRNLPFQAGQAVGFGLKKEEALHAITLAAAKILGAEKRIGSIETGKDATFFISTGDALDMRGNQITEAFIQGRKIDLDNKQKALYRKFTEKYNSEN